MNRSTYNLHIVVLYHDQKATLKNHAYITGACGSIACRRTGVDVKAGKTIRKDDQGFEVFDDYWTESGRMTLRFTTDGGCRDANSSFR